MDIVEPFCPKRSIGSIFTNTMIGTQGSALHQPSECLFGIRRFIGWDMLYYSSNSTGSGFTQRGCFREAVDK